MGSTDRRPMPRWGFLMVVPNRRSPHPRGRPAAIAALLVMALAGCVSAGGRVPETPAATAARLALPAPSTPAASIAVDDPLDACPVPATSFTPPSDRLIRVDVSSSPNADFISFEFGPPSGEPLVPAGSIAGDSPPFTLNNGDDVHVLGTNFVRLRFEGLLLVDENGKDTLRASRDVRPRLAALKEARVIDESEGVMVWVVGYSGGGCVTTDVSEKGGTVTLRIDLP